MTASIWLWSHLQATLLLALLFSLLPLQGAATRRVLIPLAALALPLWPLGTIDAAGFLYGYLGALSLPGLALLGALLLRRLGGTELLTARERHWWRAALLFGALLLYPMALGLGPFDPYGLGFSGPLLPSCLAALAILAWFTALRSGALVLLAALWAWQLRLGESANLWDYLLDPWTALALLGVEIRRLLSRRRAPSDTPGSTP